MRKNQKVYEVKPEPEISIEEIKVATPVSEIIKEVAPKEASIPKEIEPPKDEKESGSTNSLMSELTNALKSGTFSVDGAQKKEEIPLTQENLTESWKKFLTEKHAELPPNFLSNARTIEPKLGEEKIIILTTYSSVSKGFINEQGGRMKEFFRNYFRQNDIGMNIELDEGEQDVEEKKKFMSPKEQFEEMSKKNPALKDLQKRFDLDIEY